MQQQQQQLPWCTSSFSNRHPRSTDEDGWIDERQLVLVADDVNAFLYYAAIDTKRVAVSNYFATETRY